MREIQEFPKMLYHKGNVNRQRTVYSAEEEEKLGADWIDAPIDPEFDANNEPVDPEKVAHQDGKLVNEKLDPEVEGSKPGDKPVVNAKASTKK